MDGFFHVVRIELLLVLSDIWLVKLFSEIDMATTEPAVQDASKGGLGIAAIRTGMLTSVFPYEAQKS
jgi:hypothetical protein